MKTDERAPIRDHWVDRAPGDGEEARLGELLRAAVRPHPLGTAEIEAMRARLTAERRRAVRPWVWQLAIGLLVLLGGGALVAAKMHVLRWLPSILAPAKRPSASAPPANRRHPGRAAHDEPGPHELPAPPEAAPSMEAPPTTADDEPQPQHETKVAMLGRPKSALREMVPAGPAVPSTSPNDVASGVAPVLEATDPVGPAERPTPGPSALAQESKLLATALQKLRNDHDPKAALALLDEDQTRFASGALVLEAKVTRVEALLQLDRRTEALAFLDPLKAPWTGRRRDLLITRAELRAKAGRCAEALVDFGVILGSGSEASNSITERALYGRASCRARRGDGAGARADLERYLADFPEGQFAADARALLPRGSR